MVRGDLEIASRGGRGLGADIYDYDYDQIVEIPS